MRRFIALCIVACPLTACDILTIGRDDDLVDGPYTVALTEIRQTCYDVAADGTLSAEPFLDDAIPDEAAEIDVFLRPDGLVDLRHSSKWLPGSLDGGVIERIDRAAGRDLRSVDQARTTETRFSTTTVSVKGRITPETLSLAFTDVYIDKRNHCTSVTRADGFRRPVADPEAVDGYYHATLSEWGHSCPAAGAGDPARVSAGRISAAETPEGELLISMNDGALSFTVPMPDATGKIVGTRPIHGLNRYDDGIPFPVDVTGTVDGTIDENGIRFSLTYAETGDAAGCGAVIRATGPRLRPSKRTFVNDYRMEFAIEGSCLSAPTAELGVTRIEPGPDGTFILRDIGLAGTVAIDEEGVVSARSGDLATDGQKVVIDGFSAPPDLSYVVNVRLRDPFGNECSYAVTADGTARYVF